jgi:hypothetical protein
MENHLREELGPGHRPWPEARQQALALALRVQDGKLHHSLLSLRSPFANFPTSHLSLQFDFHLKHFGWFLLCSS